jgi:hypothetical protein
MPFNYDFSKLSEIKNVEVNPRGWINPLVIQYGIGEGSGPTYYWRVKGTKHTFVIPVLRLNYLSSGNYVKHFEEILEKFKENDYDKWRQEEFSAEWMQEYQSEYARFIL